MVLDELVSSELISYTGGWGALWESALLAVKTRLLVLESFNESGGYGADNLNIGVPHVSDHSKGFIFNRFLGSGSTGTVFHCRHRLDKQYYALKRCLASRSNFLSMELDVLSSLCHPNVVRYHQSWLEEKSSTGLTPSSSDNDENSFLRSSPAGQETTSTGCSDEVYLYIQMEYCPRSLEEFFEKYKFDIEWAWGAAHDLLKGLEFIHCKGYIHGDIKPSNIFLDSEERLKIADFDCALRIEGGVTQRNSGLNDLYREPERSGVGAHNTQKADIDSLGIIFAMIFADSDSDEVFYRDFETSIKNMKAGILPERLKKFPMVLKMVDENREERPSASEILSMLSRNHFE